MKKFPRFADAVVLHELTQPQAKLVLVALNALSRQLDTDSLLDQSKSVIAHSENAYCFSFHPEQRINPKLLEPQVHQLIDTLCNAYTEAREHQIHLATQELHDHYIEHFDDDVFNITHGETLRIAGHEYA